MNKVAVIHEWMTGYAGSERVLEQFLLLYPESDVYSVADLLPEKERAFLQGKTPTDSFIRRLPFSRRIVRHYLPLMPLAVEQWDLSEYDVIVSSNHAVAKGVICGPNQLHVSYVHTPIRYAWEMQSQYLREAGLTRGLRSMMIRCILHYMRLWDQASANRVDAFVANSRFIANRIWKHYRREAEVIYPPVDVDAFAPEYDKDDYYITASRLVPYKRVGLIVDAFRQMPDRKLLVVGDGPQYKKIKAQCPSNVEMLGFQSHEKLVGLMQKAKAFVFAAEEDFGIMPVEAQACGTPVIAFGSGGSLETVVDGQTGCFFEQQQPESVIEAVERFERVGRNWNLTEIRSHAEQFRPERFRREIDEFVSREWSRYRDIRNKNVKSERLGRQDARTSIESPNNASRGAEGHNVEGNRAVNVS